MAFSCRTEVVSKPLARALAKGNKAKGSNRKSKAAVKDRAVKTAPSGLYSIGDTSPHGGCYPRRRSPSPTGRRSPAFRKAGRPVWASPTSNPAKEELLVAHHQHPVRPAFPVPEFDVNPSPPIMKPAAVQPNPLNAGGFPGWKTRPPTSASASRPGTTQPERRRHTYSYNSKPPPRSAGGVQRISPESSAGAVSPW